jgi:hypothetical protein
VVPDIWEHKTILYKPILQITPSLPVLSSFVPYKLHAVLLQVPKRRCAERRPTASEAKTRMDINNTEVEMPTACWAWVALLLRLWEVLGSHFGSEADSPDFLYKLLG